MQAARGDVGRHQIAQLASLELIDQTLPLALRQIADDVLAAEAVALHARGDLESRLLGVGEDQGVCRLVARQDAEQQVELALAGNVVQLLRDLVHGDPLRRDADLGRAAHVVEGQGLDARGEGSAVQHGDALVAPRHLSDHPPQIGYETHVEHAVRLIDHQNAHLAQIQLALIGEVQQAPGRADRDAHALLQCALLLGIAHAAVEAGDGDVEVLADLARVVLDLVGQFAGRGHDQRDAVVEAALLQERLEDADQEGGRLAGSGLRLNRDVGADETIYEGLLLYRRTLGESQFVNRLQELRIKIELVESHMRLW